MNPNNRLSVSHRRYRCTDKSTVDFPVSKIPLRFVDDKYERQVSGDRGICVVRTDKKEVICHASSEYQLVPHIQILSSVEAMFEANGLEYELFDIHSGGTKGNRMYVDYILPKHKFDINGDKYTPFVQVQNSYDKFILFGLITGVYRMACTNGVLLGARNMQFLTKKHLSENISLKDIAWNIDDWIQNLKITRKQISVLLKEKLSKTTYDDIMKKILTKEKDQEKFAEEKLYQQYIKEFGENQYALFNALTAYATHTLSDEEFCKNHDKARNIQMRISKHFLQSVES